MSDPFLAEIRFFSFNFAPKGWAFCNGQVLPLSQFTALFSLIGTTYGGNGQNNFALPNMQGSTVCSSGQAPNMTNRPLGETFGAANVTLKTSQLPSHTHDFRTLSASESELVDRPSPGCHLSRTLNQFDYTNMIAVDTSLAAQTIGQAGGGAPHANQQPYLVLNACIALQGLFPKRP